MYGLTNDTGNTRRGSQLAPAGGSDRGQAAVMSHHYALPVVVAVHRQPTAHLQGRARTVMSAQPSAGIQR